MEIKKKFTWSLFAINYLIILCSYNIYIFLKHYSIDSYVTFRDINDAAMTNLNNGRPINYWVYHLMDLLNINLTVNTTLNLLVYSLVWCIFLTILVLYIIKRYNGLSIGAIVSIDIGILISFINPSVLLCTFYYSEIAVICIIGSVFLHLSILIWCFGKKKKRNIILSLIFLFLSLSVYQIYAGCFIGYTLIIFSVNYKDKIDINVIKNYLTSVFICGIACALSVLQMLVMQKLGISATGGRSASFSIEKIISNLVILLKAQGRIWLEGDTLLPYFLIMGWIIISIILILKNRKPLLFSFIVAILVEATIWGVVFGPLIISSELWMAPRTYFGMYTMVSVVVVITALSCRNCNRTTILYEGVSCIVLFLILFSLNSIQTDTIVNNNLDRNEIEIIEKNIEAYEAKTGDHVNTIEYGFDKNRTYSYSGVNHVLYDNNTRGMATTWCVQNMIPYYTGREYDIYLMSDEKLTEKFKGDDWNYFNISDQMIIEDGTVYLIIY